MNAANDNTPRLISINDTAKLTSLSRSTVNLFRFRGDFPQAVSLGERRVAFVREEVIAWIDARIAGRTAA